jgi:hypothetical protein
LANGSLDFLPDGNSSTQMGLRMDMTSVSNAVTIRTRKASDGTFDDTASYVRFNPSLMVTDDKNLFISSNQWNKISQNTTSPQTLQIGVFCTDTFDSSGALALVSSSHMGGALRNPGVTYQNPTFVIYSGNIAKAPSDAIRFYHDGDKGNIVVGITGTKGPLHLDGSVVGITNAATLNVSTINAWNEFSTGPINGQTFDGGTLFVNSDQTMQFSAGNASGGGLGASGINGRDLKLISNNGNITTSGNGTVLTSTATGITLTIPNGQIVNIGNGAFSVLGANTAANRRVGIGTTSPRTGFKLDINGIVGLSGGLSADGGSTFAALVTFQSGINSAGATFTANIIAPNIVNSINGRTGDLQGVTSINGLTGTITNVAFTNNGNTFSVLQSFAAGISADGGATFNGVASFNSGITASGITSSSGYRITSSAINQQTASYTLTGADSGKIIGMSAATGITLTVPSGLPIGFVTTVISFGAGLVGISAAGGVTINSFEGKKRIAGQHAAVSLISYLTDVYNLAGGLTA